MNGTLRLPAWLHWPPGVAMIAILGLMASGALPAVSAARAQDETPPTESGPVAGKAAEATVRLLSGETRTGRLQGVTAEALLLADQPPVPLAQLERVSLGEPPLPNQEGLRTQLADGTRLVAKQLTVANNQATITTQSGDEVKLPSTDLREVLFGPLPNELAGQWEQKRALETASDLLVVEKDGELRHYEGVVGDITDERVFFSVGDSDPIKALRAKVVGVILFQNRREFAAPVCEVVERDGTRWQARTLAVAGADLKIETPLGVTLNRPLGRLSLLDFSQGKIIYLTDLEPLQQKVTPFFDLTPEPRINQNLEGGPLKIGGQEFDNGIAVHSRTELVYPLRGEFSRFVATVGIDEVVGDLGHAVLTISGDNRQLYSKTLTGSADAEEVELDVSGVQRLKILVDFGEDLDVADHVDICQARIIK